MWIAGFKKGSTTADDAVGFYCVDLSAVLSTGGSPAQCATSFVPLATGTEVNVGTSFGRASGNDLGLNEIRSVDGVSTAGTFSETRIWASLASNGKIICLDTATGSACPAMPSNGWPTAVKGWKLDSSTIGGENTSNLCRGLEFDEQQHGRHGHIGLHARERSFIGMPWIRRR